MCVAAVIYKPVSLDYLKEMHDSNPHGAGVAWPDYAAGVMRFKKGLTYEEIHALQEAGELTYPYLLHFRWATEGDKVPQMTHPFPVGVRALFGELEGTADQVLIHNGTMSWSQQKYWVPDTDYMYHLPWELINRASDTAIAAWLIKEPGSEDILKALQWATCLASVRDGALHLEKTGDWKEHQGNSYSNLSWLPWSARGGRSDYFSDAEYGGWRYDGDYGHAWGFQPRESGRIRGRDGSVGETAGDVAGKLEALEGSFRSESQGSREKGLQDESGKLSPTSGLSYTEFQQVAVKILGPEPIDYNSPDWGPEYVSWYQGKQQLLLMTSEELDELLTAVEMVGYKTVRAALEAEMRAQKDMPDKESKMLSQVTQKHFSSFDEYCRAKYGDECAESVGPHEWDDDFVLMPGDDAVAGQTVADPDLVSEDPEAVNAWLARQMIG